MAGTWTRTLARLGLGRGMGPVRWARWGPISTLLAHAVPAAKPPVLVLSLARSGSSWVGHILGLSAGALYLREPVTQTLLERRGLAGSPDVAGDPMPHRAWRAAAKDALRGVPRYRSTIVATPSQWRLAERPRRRLVLKEVEPAALEWLLARRRFRTVFLVRHPAAVAQSGRALGWWGAADAADEPAWWRAQGDWQGRSIAPCLERLEGREDARVVRYEDLCEAPEPSFRALYAFCGLPWSDDVARTLARETTAEGPYQAGGYDLARDSRGMVDRWREAVAPEQLAALAEGWLAHGLGLYGPGSFRTDG